jgi:hypothetical protein
MHATAHLHHFPRQPANPPAALPPPLRVRVHSSTSTRVPRHDYYYTCTRCVQVQSIYAMRGEGVVLGSLSLSRPNQAKMPRHDTLVAIITTTRTTRRDLHLARHGNGPMLFLLFNGRHME